MSWGELTCWYYVNGVKCPTKPTVRGCTKDSCAHYRQSSVSPSNLDKAIDAVIAESRRNVR